MFAGKAGSLPQSGEPEYSAGKAWKGQNSLAYLAHS